MLQSVSPAKNDNKMDFENKELWNLNTPARFWLCKPDISEELWQDAIRKSIPILGLANDRSDIESLLALTLGEGCFGSDHWTLSMPKKIYYLLKPALPRVLTRILRRGYLHIQKTGLEIQWPIDRRYVFFLWNVLTRILRGSPGQKLLVKSLWPDNQRFSFVLTHDVESQSGLEYVRKVADLEESLGFRSSFNFVPEAYQVDKNLLDELRRRGFEIGIHGLKHDGKLFSSRNEFERRATKINHYLKDFGAVGFRAPLTHRNPEWMQALDIEYDLSFFDTDPFEPIPGGTMSIWPFFIGNFVELPYTLVQDYTLTTVLGETTPHLWLEKVSFVEKFHGMALVNTHPDYLKSKLTWDVYCKFLSEMKMWDCYWNALPREVSRWWKSRVNSSSSMGIFGRNFSKALLDGDSIRIEV